MARKPETQALMTADQAKELRRLALDAYEPEAYSPNLTNVEAEMRIRILRAKLTRLSEPPHTQGNFIIVSAPKPLRSTGRHDENNRDYIRWCFADAEMAKAFAAEFKTETE